MDSPTPVGYPARAIVGGETVAVSNGAVRVDRVETAPQLWFPRADVSAAALNRSDGHWVQGRGDLTDYVTVDPDQVLLEIVDTVDGDDERDVTTKRFCVLSAATPRAAVPMKKMYGNTQRVTSTVRSNCPGVCL